MKICKKCELDKELEDYYSNGKGGLMGTCKACYNLNLRTKYKADETFKKQVLAKNRNWKNDNYERYKETRNKWSRETATGVYQTLKRSSKIKDAQHIISKQDFIEWYNKADKVCEYCGVKETDVQFNPLLFRHSLRLSIDCKIPELNYVNDNLALCCYVCNTVKNNIFTYEEMKEIGKKYISNKIKTS